MRDEVTSFLAGAIRFHRVSIDCACVVEGPTVDDAAIIVDGTDVVEDGRYVIFYESSVFDDSCRDIGEDAASIILYYSSALD